MGDKVSYDHYFYARMTVFTLNVQSHGWADLMLQSSQKICSVAVTNVGPNDAVIDTIIACLALMEGASYVAISYFSEPGEHRLRINRSGDELHLSVRWFPDGTAFHSTEEFYHDNERLIYVGDESPWPASLIVFEATVSIWEFAGDVCSSVERNLSRFGPDEYRHHWSDDYPDHEIDRLKRTIECRLKASSRSSSGYTSQDDYALKTIQETSGPHLGDAPAV